MINSPGSVHALQFGSAVMAFMGFQYYLSQSGYLAQYPWAFIAIGLFGIYHFGKKQ